MNQVGLPTCCFGIQLSMWENCQLFSYSIFQENIVQQKPIKFQRSQSTKQTLSPGETQLYLSSQLEETHYQCVNMNSSRKQTFAFLPCASMNQVQSAHFQTNVTLVSTPASTKFTDTPEKQRVGLDESKEPSGNPYTQ